MFFYTKIWSTITINAVEIILYQFYAPNETNKDLTSSNFLDLS